MSMLEEGTGGTPLLGNAKVASEDHLGLLPVTELQSDARGSTNATSSLWNASTTVTNNPTVGGGDSSDIQETHTTHSTLSTSDDVDFGAGVIAGPSRVSHSAPTEPKTMWLYLPDELTLRIFSLLRAGELVSAGRVCKQWRELSRVGDLWRAMVASEYNFDGLNMAAIAGFRNLCDPKPSWRHVYADWRNLAPLNGKPRLTKAVTNVDFNDYETTSRGFALSPGRSDPLFIMQNFDWPETMWLVMSRKTNKVGMLSYLSLDPAYYSKKAVSADGPLRTRRKVYRREQPSWLPPLLFAFFMALFSATVIAKTVDFPTIPWSVAFFPADIFMACIMYFFMSYVSELNFNPATWDRELAYLSGGFGSFLLVVFSFFLALRLDNVVKLTWAGTLWPLWVFAIVVALTPIARVYLNDGFTNGVGRSIMGIAYFHLFAPILGCVPFVGFIVMVAYKLDGLFNVPWVQVFIPVWCILGLYMIGAIAVARVCQGVPTHIVLLYFLDTFRLPRDNEPVSPAGIGRRVFGVLCVGLLGAGFTALLATRLDNLWTASPFFLVAAFIPWVSACFLFYCFDIGLIPPLCVGGPSTPPAPARPPPGFTGVPGGGGPVGGPGRSVNAM